MALQVKPGVQFTFAPGGFRILEVLKEVALLLGRDLTITSGCDGVHSGPSDPHFSGNAYDIRTHDLAIDVQLRVFTLLTQRLGPRFYVLHEDQGTDNDHIHVQVKKATVYSMFDYLKDA